MLLIWTSIFQKREATNILHIGVKLKDSLGNLLGSAIVHTAHGRVYAPFFAVVWNIGGKLCGLRNDTSIVRLKVLRKVFFSQKGEVIRRSPYSTPGIAAPSAKVSHRQKDSFNDGFGL